MPASPDLTKSIRGDHPQDERIRLLALTADVGTALTTHPTLGEMLRGCAEALVTHLDAAFARVWVLDQQAGVLVLHASAGLYTHLDGPHGRVPVGQFKIGMIAQEGKPHLTNTVIGDPRVSDQAWARREGMVSFAGYPLCVEGRVIGVVAMFARHPLSEVTIHTLGSVADEIALGIEGKRAEEALRASEARYRAAFQNAAVGVTLADLQGRFVQVNPAFCAITGYAEEELFGSDYQSLTHPDDLGTNLSLMRRMVAGEMPSFVLEKRYIRKDGRTVWVQNSMSVVRDAQGVPIHTVALTEDISERKQGEEALRAANERTAAILESITDAFFALDRDWRFTYLNDQAERFLLRSRADLLGKVIWDEFPAAIGSTFDVQYRRAAAERSAVTFEAYYPPPLDAWFEVRAFPSESGLSVYFHDITARRTAETARDQAQAALLEHERVIASQLQAALQPELPGAVPGLRLAKHYKAALAEAGVGGDFYDVFSLEKGCTALVVGDLAGKGLAAAAQVATVRNTLRGFLYIQNTVAEAVHDLNRVLAENDLLTGFATLFVGAYDAGTLTLNYCNCGQEPALLRRASTGAVEQLLPTGPVIGAIEGARFSEATVMLAPGDALAVFSDGLTECGPDRKAMLGIEGVTELFGPAPEAGEAGEAQQLDAQTAAERLVLQLIEGVNRYAHGGARDDVALLVGVVP